MIESDPTHESTENTDRPDRIDPSEIKEWHKRVLLCLATGKPPMPSRQIMKYLDKHDGMSRSYNAIATVCQKTLSALITTEDHSIPDDTGDPVRADFRYALKTDLQTFYVLHDIFDTPDMYDDFSFSPLFRDMVPAVPGEFDRAMPFWCCTIPVDGGIIPLVRSLSPEQVIEAIQNVDDLVGGGNNAIVCAIATIDGQDLTIKPKKDHYHLRDDEKEAIKRMKNDYLKREISYRRGDLFLVLKPRLSDATVTHLERFLESDRLTLRAVLRYIFANYEKRSATYKQIVYDLNNPEIAPGICESRIYREHPDVDMRDDEIGDLHDAVYYDTGIDWIRFFGYLRHIFVHYGFFNRFDHRYHHLIESF